MEVSLGRSARMFDSTPYKCNLDPDTNTCLKVYLFKDVKNVEAIRQNVIKGIWKCSVIKPSLILDAFQVAVAANRAVLAEKAGTMVTKTVYSEIVYNLAVTKNITQGLNKFGIEKDNNMLVCFLINNEYDVSEDVVKEIEGQPCSLASLANFTNVEAVKTAYKLKSDVDLLGNVVSKIATKNCIHH